MDIYFIQIRLQMNALKSSVSYSFLCKVFPFSAVVCVKMLVITFMVKYGNSCELGQVTLWFHFNEKQRTIFCFHEMAIQRFQVVDI